MLVKDLLEATSDSIEKKIQAKQNALEVAREKRKMKGQRIQSQREVKLDGEIMQLRQQLRTLQASNES